MLRLLLTLAAARATSADLVTVYTVEYGAEIAWEILDGTGSSWQVLCAGDGYTDYFTYYSACGSLPDYYVVNLYDAYGDGWNGGTMTIDSSSTVNLEFLYGSELSYHVVSATISTGANGNQVAWLLSASDGTTFCEGGGYESSTVYETACVLESVKTYEWSPSSTQAVS